MSSALTEPGTATETRSGDRRPPARLHHNNFYTSDLEATRHFYEDVAGLPLRVAARAHEMMRRYLAGDRTPTLPEKL